MSLLFERMSRSHNQLFALQGRRCKCQLNRPLSQPVANRLCVDPEPDRPILNTQSFVVESNESIVPVITALHVAGCPVAILRLINSVIILALNGMLRRWTRAHVGKKILKLHPLLAESYAAIAVVMARRIVRVPCSLLDAMPNPILRCLGLVVGADAFCVETATRLGESSFDANGTGAFSRAAHAETLPNKFRLMRNRANGSSELSNDSQSPEYHSNRILGYNFFSRHVHSFSVNALIRALGSLQRSQGLLILA